MKKKIFSLGIAALAASLTLCSAADFTGNLSRTESVLADGWTVLADSLGTEYVNVFDIPYSDMGRHVELCLDCVKGPYVLSVNGAVIGEQSNGSIPACYDITPYIVCGEPNTLSVKAGAIVGEVRLVRTNPIHIAEGGTSVRTNWGKVSISTTLANDDFKAIRSSTVAVIYNITGPYGEQVLTSPQLITELSPSQTGTVSTDLTVPVPFMWDFDARYTYHLNTKVICSDKVVDEQDIAFAFRDIEFHSGRGFLLNNRRVLLVGAIISTDPAGLGTAIPAQLWRYRLQKIRDLGFNAVMCKDFPASPQMLSVCDDIGLLVIDCTGIAGISNSDLYNFRSLVARDGNHPSLMLWGLDVPQELCSNPRGHDFLQIGSQRARQIDPWHKTFCANTAGNSLEGAADVNGANIGRLGELDSQHSAHPDEFIIGMNAPATSEMFDYFEGKKYLGGFFIDESCLFDGNSNPMPGALFIQTRAWARPVVQVCGLSDQSVRVYSNCDEVDVVIGNKPLARRRVSREGYADFTVSGRWSNLIARAYKRGGVAATSKFTKPGPVPVITASKLKMNADGTDVVVFDIVCSQPFEFSFSGPATLLGGSNGESANVTTVTPVDGRAQVILKSLSGKIGFVNVSVPGQKAPIVVSVI